jgi:hypothetical protein
MGKSEDYEDLCTKASPEGLLENGRSLVTRRSCLTRHAQTFHWAVSGREVAALPCVSITQWCLSLSIAIASRTLLVPRWHRPALGSTDLPHRNF